MPKPEEQVVELTPEVIKQIAEAMPAPQIDADAIAEKMLEKQKAAAEKNDPEVNKLDTKNKESKKPVEESGYAAMTKEAFAVAQLNAALQGNGKELGEMNKFALKTLKDAGYIEKATYLNAGTTADGGAFVPNADLLKDIFTVLPNYSSVASLAREITLTEGDSLDVSTLTADVVMTEVGSEGGSKTVTKPTIGDGNVAVREFAGIALMTKKLLRQSAIDVYAVIRDSFARAIAKKREQLLLSDSSSGIITKITPVKNATANAGNAKVDSLTIKQLKKMPFLVPTSSANGGTYVFSRLLLAELDGKEDTTGQPIVTINPGQTGGALSGTFNGYPFVVAETLGATDSASTVHAVFGNWREYAIVLKQGAVDSQVFDSGTVTDGSSVVHNLIQENKVAMRVEMWENVGFPIPTAFTALSTTAAS